MNSFFILLLLATIAFQAWLTREIWRCDAYDRDQRTAQTRLIWLLPLVGALVVYAVYLDATKTPGSSS